MADLIYSGPLKKGDTILLFGLDSQEDVFEVLNKIGEEGQLFIVDPFATSCLQAFNAHPQIISIVENRRFSNLIERLSSALSLTTEARILSEVKIALCLSSFRRLLEDRSSSISQEIKILLQKKELNQVWINGRAVPPGNLALKFLQILKIVLVSSPGIASLNRLLEARVNEAFSKETKKISIIILAWNGWERFTKPCLLSIFEKTEYPDYEVIVVDNGSMDGTLAGLKSLGSKIVLIANKENMGFSFGNNQAAKIAKGDYLLFLNNDTFIRSGDWLTIMADTLGLHPRIGATGQLGVIYLDDKSDAFAQVVFIPEIVIPVAWLAGYCLMVKKEAFFEAKCFRDDLYGIAGCEDIHLGYALRESGWLSVTTSKWIYLDHFVGGSKKANPSFRNNYEILTSQWGPRRRILNCAKSNETA